jgi:hypothetical protein
MTLRRTRSIPFPPTPAAILVIALSSALVAAGCARDGDQPPAVAAETSTSVASSALSTTPSSEGSSTTRAGSSTTLVPTTLAPTGRTATPTTRQATPRSTATTRRTTTTRRTATTAPVFQLTIVIAGGRPDAKVVVSDGGVCPPRCRYSFDKDKSVTLTPNPQNHHQNWSPLVLNCNQSPGQECTVEMTQNWTVTATFDTNTDDSAG